MIVGDGKACIIAKLYDVKPFVEFWQRAERAVLGAIINNKALKILFGLRQHGRHGLLQPFTSIVIDNYDRGFGDLNLRSVCHYLVAQLPFHKMFIVALKALLKPKKHTIALQTKKLSL